jgi:uncharacterized protein (DUF1778 family)
MNTMRKSSILSFRVSAEQKALINSACQRKGITESAYFRRLIEMAVTATGDVPLPRAEHSKRVPGCSRVSLRLRPDDCLLIRQRAKSEFLSMSGYGERITREHVRGHYPLPTAELEALKESIAELKGIGRRLNEVARALNQGQDATLPSTDNLRTLLTALGRVRDRFRALVDANRNSWLAPGDLRK